MAISARRSSPMAVRPPPPCRRTVSSRSSRTIIWACYTQCPGPPGICTLTVIGNSDPVKKQIVVLGISINKDQLRISLECVSLPAWHFALQVLSEHVPKRKNYGACNVEADAAGRVAGVDPIEEITLRCIRIIETPETGYGACACAVIYTYIRPMGDVFMNCQQD